ncbi:MAG: acyl-CoA dehydrogenase family protein [Acidobacteriota bacterium]|nr:acyl-CoA dehydrogenase family protein [Acidobacteriota bacterium]
MHLELTAEQARFQQAARDFADTAVAPRAAEIDASDRFPADLVSAAAERGLLGVTVPEACGGAGRDYVSYALAIEAVAAASATLGAVLVVNNSLVAEVLQRFGTAEQKERWLARLASGRSLGAFALSEAQAGTDAARQETTAAAAGDGYVLRGRKVWVANGAAAEVAVVFAATGSAAGGRGVSAFLVPTDRPGLTREPTADPLGVRGLGCVDLRLDDVEVGADALLAGPGRGFDVARWALDGGRIAIGAEALGVGRAAFDEALRHARTRETFGRPIGRYQAIQWPIADTATELEAARMLVLRAAAAKDVRERIPLEASMAKLAASEAALRAADRAMRILASAGYRRGTVVERLLRDARALEIVAGTSEAQRMIIAAQVAGGTGSG